MPNGRRWLRIRYPIQPSEVYNAQAAEDAWKRVTALFRENL